MKVRNMIMAIFLFWGITLPGASIQRISIGVNGLTCSMCTRSVEMSIRKLDFVDSVAMDLAQTEGVVYLKPNSSIDLRKVAKAITNAGFSVRFMRITVAMGESAGQECFSIGPDSFQFIDSDKIPSSANAELILIGDEFMPRKQADKYKRKMVGKCPSKNGFYVSRV